MLQGISTNLTANTVDFFFRIHKRVRIHYVYGNPIHKSLHRSINSRKFICGNKVFPLDSRFKLSGHTSVVANKYAAFGSSFLFTESAIKKNYNGIIFRKIIFQIDLVFKIVIVSENECFIYIARMHPKTTTRLQLTMLKFNTGCCHGNLPKLAIIGAAASMSRDLLELLVRELENI